MKIGYLWAAKSSRVVGNSAEAVHVQSMCRAFQRLGHQVFIVSGELEEFEKFQNTHCPFPLTVIPSPNPLPFTSWLYQWARSHLMSQSANQTELVAPRPAAGYVPTWRLRFVWKDLEQRISTWRYQRHFYRQAYKVLEQEQPDVLYERYNQYGLAGIWLAKELRKPIIVEINGSLTQRHEWFRQPSPLFPFMIKKTERYLCKHATAVVVVCAMLLSCLREIGVLEGRLIVLPNASDLDLIRCDDLSVLKIRQKYELVGKFVVGFVGSMRPWHDVATLLEGVRLAALNRPEIFSLIVGDGPARHALEQRAQELGLSGRVIFTGAIPHQDIAGYIASMDIATVLRSADNYFSGGASMKVFEYMAMAKPVIASGLGLPDDIIQHRKNGILVEPENPRQVADAILELVTDPDLRERLGQEARRSVETRHTWEHNAQAVIDLYERFGAQ